MQLLQSRALPLGYPATEDSKAKFLFLPAQVQSPFLSCSFQNWKRVCELSWNGSKDGTMEQDDGFGVWIGGVTEIIDVTVWAETTDDGAAWWRWGAFPGRAS